MQRLTLILILFVLMILSCSEDNFVCGYGKIIYLDFEGGFYGIEADNGEHYDPINLPTSFYQDSLRIYFRGIALYDRASFNQWGTLLELTEIYELK